MRFFAALICATLALLALPALAQDRKIYLSWAPKGAPMPYSGVNRPVWRMSDILRRHPGNDSWTQDVTETERYSAKWIQMAPGEKTRTRFYGDDRTVWIVWRGKLRFTVAGQHPFVATKGFLVQVPPRTPYSMETVGGGPALRLEITRGGALPSYPLDGGARPPAVMGQHYVKIRYPSMDSGMNGHTAISRPYLDFFKEVVAVYPHGGGPRLRFFVNDKNNQAAVIRGMGVAIPPAINKGHFHIGNDEFWFIPEGRIAFQIEGVGLIQAGPGDLVLATPQRWHRASFAPGQMDTRIAFNRSPTMLHNYAEDANGAQ